MTYPAFNSIATPHAHPVSTCRLNLASQWPWARTNRQHRWLVLESVERRLAKSMSDLDGTDPYIHDGTMRGVMREVCNAFVRPNQPTVPQMMKMYRDLRRSVPKILRNAGTTSLFTARAFSDLCLGAAGLRSKYVGRG